MKKRQIIFVFALALLSATYTVAKTPPGYNTPIPSEIMTPDTVKTKYLGTLKFTDGRPAKETADKLYDHLVYLRAIEVFLNWMPACSIEAMQNGTECEACQ